MPVVSRPQRTEAIQAKYNVTVEFPHLGLHSAAATGNVGLVKYALDHGQPINSVLDGVLPLHAACSGGNDNVVRLLIEKGADVNAPRLPRRYSTDKNRDGSAPIVGTSGSTPLHFACANGHTPVVLTLLMHGAHPDRGDKHGTTPEVLARQNGWTACAEVLHNWTINKDRDLREKDELIPSHTTYVEATSVIDSKHVCGGHECRICTSKRLRVKRSIDHALNMLKPSLSQLHSSNLGDCASTALETIMASPLLPTDFAGEPVLRSSPETTTTPESCDRRPSLPDIFDPSQTVPMSRRARGGSGASSRRPRSAGNDSEQPLNASRRVKGKVSLLNIFKKGDPSITPETSPGYASSSYTPSVSSAFASPGPGTPRRSDARIPTPANDSLIPATRSAEQASFSESTIEARPRGRVFSEGEATRVPPLPTAVDLHRALSDDRSRTLSSPGPADAPVDVSCGPPPAHRSPSLRPGILRPHNRSFSQQSPYDSPRAGSVGPPTSRSLRFDPPSTTNLAAVRPNDARRGSSHSPARGIKMARSVSSMRSVIGAEATRSPLRTAIEIDGPSYDESITDEPRDVFEDDDEEYGEPIVTQEAMTELDSRLSALQVTEDTKRNSIFTQASLSPLPSPSRENTSTGFDCPFSINEPPPEDLESPTRQTFLGVHGNENRGRGDSMSSMSTNGTGGFLPTPGMQQSQLPPPWISSCNTTPPEYPMMDHGGRRRIQRAPSTYSSDTEHVHKRKGPPNALDIDIGTISSYAQAEALVQRAQQSILELQDTQVDRPPPSIRVGAGQTPLSAKLAAYGESLAIERKFRQEEQERRNSSSTVRSRRPSEYSTRALEDVFESSPGTKSLDRKFSLEERPYNRTIRQSKVRRPHTAGSTTASDILGSPNGHGRSIQSLRHFPASGPHLVVRSSSDQRVVTAASSYTPPISSFLNTDVDMYAGSGPRVPRSRTPDPCRDEPLDRGPTTGVPLSRISTAPVQDTYLKPKRGLTEQERQVARATKLVKMGFSTADTFAANGVNRQQTMNRHRFGGFKGFVQSLKGK